MRHVCKAPGRFLLFQNHTVCTVLEELKASKVISRINP